MIQSCRDSPINAFWNNATATPDQSIVNAPLLPTFFIYAVVGGVSSVFNVICILIFVTKKELLQKYLLFAFLAFANLMNTLFMLLAGIIRRHLIFTNQYSQLRSTFECLLFPWPHFQLLGSQLPSVVLLIIDIERLIAVYRPVFYKVNVTDRNRGFLVIGCCVVVGISQLFGYLSSYLNRATCTTSFCNVISSYGINYCNYNSAIVILLPIFALVLNIFTYVRVRRLQEHTNMKKELNFVLVALIITFVDVILIACPNIIVLGANNGIFPIPSATVGYFYVFFCCNSAINLFVYICFKRDFRDHLFMLIARGPLKSLLKLTTNTKKITLVVPSNGP